MKKNILLILIVILFLIFLNSCEETDSVSKEERLEMFVSDINASRYNSMYEHFSEDHMQNDWGTVTSGATYWNAGTWLNAPFTYSITSKTSNTITADFNPGSYTMKFYFVNVGDSDSEDWLIYRLDIGGTTELD